MRKIVYTAITGDYDHVQEPVKCEGWEYKLITNSFSIDPKNWDVIHSPTVIDNTRTARHAKLHPWEYFDADLSIWIDANVKITCDFNALVDIYKDGEFTIMRHPDRDCVYQELEACKRGLKDDFTIMNNQVNLYRSFDYPSNNGMVSSGMHIKEHTQSVKNFCDKWWQEIVNHSYRDQLSFNYTAWKNNYRFKYMPFLFNIPMIGLMMIPGHPGRVIKKPELPKPIIPKSELPKIIKPEIPKPIATEPIRAKQFFNARRRR